MVLLHDLHTGVYLLIQRHVCTHRHTQCVCCSLTSGFQRHFHLVSLRSGGDWKWERKSLVPWETELGCSLLNKKEEKPLRTQLTHLDSLGQWVPTAILRYWLTTSWLTTTVRLKACFRCLGNIIYIGISRHQSSSELPWFSVTIVDYSVK